MAHRLAFEAEADLDDIWYFIASQSGNPEVADRFIDSLSVRFLLLARHPHLGRRLACAAFPSAGTSSCTASSPMATC